GGWAERGLSLSDLRIRVINCPLSVIRFFEEFAGVDGGEHGDEHYAGGGPEGAGGGGVVDGVEGVVEQQAADHGADGAGEAGAGLEYAERAALALFGRDL